jgi:hypothetical protein
MNTGRYRIHNCLTTPVLQFIYFLSGHSVPIFPKHLKKFSFDGGIVRILAVLNVGLPETDIQIKACVGKLNLVGRNLPP